MFATFDSSRAYSQTAAGKCRLAPCILIILDTSQLYDLTVKTLFKLHGCKCFIKCLDIVKSFVSFSSKMNWLLGESEPFVLNHLRNVKHLFG